MRPLVVSTVGGALLWVQSGRLWRRGAGETQWVEVTDVEGIGGRVLSDAEVAILEGPVVTTHE